MALFMNSLVNLHSPFPSLALSGTPDIRASCKNECFSHSRGLAESADSVKGFEKIINKKGIEILSRRFFQ